MKVLDSNDTERMSWLTVKVRKVDNMKVLDGNNTEEMSKPTVKVQKVDECCLMYLVHNEDGWVVT